MSEGERGPPRRADEPTTDRLIGRVVGNFVVEHKLGEGGMGAVYRMRHRHLGDTFQALKVLTRPVGGDGLGEREMLDRFLQEARAAAAVDSHRVVQIFDVGEFDDGTRYLLMEYVRGRSLAAALGERGPLPLAEALLIATRVADTLAIAHQRGIVHRDIKPANLMLASEGRDPAVKILDFGIARASGDVKVAHTTERKIIGSPGYMSPEAALGAPVDGRADVFALTVTLFEMLAGRGPFGGDNFNQILMNTLVSTPPPAGSLRPPHLGAVPAAVEELLLRGLCKDPLLRMPMAALLAELVRVADAAAVEGGAALALSVMRSFAPAAAERPTLAVGMTRVSDVVGRYAGRTPTPEPIAAPPAAAPVPPAAAPAPAPSWPGAAPSPPAAAPAPSWPVAPPTPHLAHPPPSLLAVTAVGPAPPLPSALADAQPPATAKPAVAARPPALLLGAAALALVAAGVAFSLAGRPAPPPPPTPPVITTPPPTPPVITAPPPTRPVITAPPATPPVITAPPATPPVITAPPATLTTPPPVAPGHRRRRPARRPAPSDDPTVIETRGFPR